MRFHWPESKKYSVQRVTEGWRGSEVGLPFAFCTGVLPNGL
jgi:hypothetical protein